MLSRADSNTTVSLTDKKKMAYIKEKTSGIICPKDWDMLELMTVIWKM